MFYKTIRVELIVYLLQLYVFYYSRFARYTARENDSTVSIIRLSLRGILLVFNTFSCSDILCGKDRLDITIFSGVSSVFTSHFFALDTSFIYLFICVQSASYLMYYIAAFGTIFAFNYL